jgi:hypothetical protein
LHSKRQLVSLRISPGAERRSIPDSKEWTGGGIRTKQALGESPLVSLDVVGDTVAVTARPNAPHDIAHSNAQVRAGKTLPVLGSCPDPAVIGRGCSAPSTQRVS